MITEQQCCRSTMEMLFSVGKIAVVLRLLASHVYWIVVFIKVPKAFNVSYTFVHQSYLERVALISL